MNKYELALVVAQTSMRVRNATVEQVKELITRFSCNYGRVCEKKKHTKSRR